MDKDRVERSIKRDSEDQFEITEMPDKELLEDFLRSLSQVPTVIFNSETGKFVRAHGKKKEPKTDEPV